MLIRSRPLLVVALVLVAFYQLTAAAAQAPPPAYRAAVAVGAGWNADFDGDGVSDFCAVVTRPGFSGVSCTLAATKRRIASANIDLGYAEGRAWVDVNGDSKQDFCRVIGNGYPSSYVTCLLSAGTSFGREVQSDSLDWGYPETRQWRDANGDSKADFCRVTGNNRESMACTFSLGTKFGNTVANRR